MTDITFEKADSAVRKGGSGRQAAKLLGKSYTSFQWWLARNGYRVEKRAVLVKVGDQKGDK